MHSQVGDLVIDDDGIAQKGLLVRHLVMPDGLAARAGHALPSPGYLKEHLCEHHGPVPALSQGPCRSEDRQKDTAAEYEEALDAAKSAGISRLDSE